MWACPDCAKINADLWTMRAVVGAHALQEAGNELVLVTITAHERHSIKRAVEVLPSGWNALRCRWRREVGRADYLMIPEVGSKGHFHLHFITTGRVGTRWWKDNARASGFGYCNDESEGDLSASKSGFYVGKYLAKQLHNNVWKKGFHRVRTSQGWPKVQPLARPDGWEFVPFVNGLPVPSCAQSLAAQGYSVALADDRASWAFLATGELTEGAVWLTLPSPYTTQKEG